MKGRDVIDLVGSFVTLRERERERKKRKKERKKESSQKVSSYVISNYNIFRVCTVLWVQRVLHSALNFRSPRFIVSLSLLFLSPIFFPFHFIIMMMSEVSQCLTVIRTFDVLITYNRERFNGTVTTGDEHYQLINEAVITLYDI